MSAENEFSIGGRDFILRKIDAMKQFHIVRRISPILADLLPALKSMQGLDQLDQIAKFVSPIMEGMSKLSDQDAEIVLYGLLSAVEVKQPTGNWAKLTNGSMLMIQDLELPVLLQIAGKSFVYNLSGFFAAVPKPS